MHFCASSQLLRVDVVGGGGMERYSDLFIKLWAASTTGGQRQSSAPSKCSKRESSGFCPTAFHVLSMKAITTL